SEVVEKTKAALLGKRYSVFLVKDHAEALNKIKELIPTGSSVVNGSSKTLEQIGYIDYLYSGTSGSDNLKGKMLEEKDLVKQALLRRQSTVSDWYLGSVHALIENGEFIIASNSGSQLPSVIYTSQNVIFVVSTKKIVKDFNQGMDRLQTYVIPREDEN